MTPRDEIQQRHNEEALTSNNPVARCMARGVASGWGETLEGWMNAELARPNADPADILYALTSLQVQVFAAFLGVMADGDPEAIAGATDTYVEIARRRIPGHAAIAARLHAADDNDIDAILAAHQQAKAAGGAS